MLLDDEEEAETIAAAGGDAILRIFVTKDRGKWSETEVVLDGRSVGTVPVSREVSTGRHEITWKNGSFEKTCVVFVPPEGFSAGINPVSPSCPR